MSPQSMTWANADAQTMRDTLAHIRSHYGGIAEYLIYAGFDAESQQRLRDALKPTPPLNNAFQQLLERRADEIAIFDNVPTHDNTEARMEVEIQVTAMNLESEVVDVIGVNESKA